MREFRSQKSTYLYILFAVLLLVFIVLLVTSVIGKKYLFINISSSVPLGIYSKDRKLELKRGKYVTFYLPEAITEKYHSKQYASSRTLRLKKVIATAGEKVCYSSGLLTIGNVSKRILNNIPLDSPNQIISKCVVVPEGSVYLLGLNNARSFDSRYYGPISIEQVRSSATPIFTF